ncbi:MAG: hypothetical protein JWR55_1990 [Aeromicrobium sp.]|jgi:hypothetical protein|nr:hypothetical protein [Aeromicrobium sp.]
MENMTTPLPDESVLPHRRVRADLLGGGAVLAVVIVGNLLWHASDAGILSAFGSH